MAKKENKAHLEKQKLKAQATDEVTYPPRVEKIYKIVLRSMSWIVGVAFVAVLILPLFNSTVLDSVTTVLFRIGFSILIIFLFIELVSDRIKSIIAKVFRD